MDKIYSEWLGKITLMLVKKIGKNYYEIITTDTKISKTNLSNAIKGEDQRIRYYIIIIAYIMDSIRLTIEMGILLKELRKVLNDNHDLLITTVPSKSSETPAPESWSVLIKWNRRAKNHDW